MRIQKFVAFFKLLKSDTVLLCAIDTGWLMGDPTNHANMSSEDWIEAVKNASHRYGLAKGPIARLKQYAECLGKKWIRGQSYCKVFYRFAPD